MDKQDHNRTDSIKAKPTKAVIVLESKLVRRDGEVYQRVIFSDDKIIYVDIDTGEVTPESTPDAYVDLVSIYNSNRLHHTTNTVNQANPIPNGLRQGAMVIDVICLFIFGLMGISGRFVILIALVWIIPMTIMTAHSITDEKEHVALGVCHIFFFSPISGILILVSNGQVKDR